MLSHSTAWCVDKYVCVCVCVCMCVSCACACVRARVCAVDCACRLSTSASAMPSQRRPLPCCTSICTILVRHLILHPVPFFGACTCTCLLAYHRLLASSAVLLHHRMLDSVVTHFIFNIYNVYRAQWWHLASSSGPAKSCWSPTFFPSTQPRRSHHTLALSTR